MRRDEVLRILREHWAEIRAFDVTGLYLFGSVARDEATPESDVDILVDFDPAASVGMFKYLRLQRYLASLLGRKVDLVTREAIRPQLAKYIFEDLVNAA